MLCLQTAANKCYSLYLLKLLFLVVLVHGDCLLLLCFWDTLKEKLLGYWVKTSFDFQVWEEYYGGVFSWL